MALPDGGFNPKSPEFDEEDFRKWVKEQFQPTEVPITTDQYIYATVATWHPEQKAIAAIPAEPPTSTQVTFELNQGWNSHARSIDPIAKEEYAEFAVNTGIQGAFLGLATKNRDSYPIGSFTHGLLADNTGIWAFEEGEKIIQIKSLQLSESYLRIIRQVDNTVVYMVVTGTESFFHVSTVKAQNTVLYGYGFLYSSGDTVNEAALTTGHVEFVEV